ncbi:FecCD family ABC transporter permease [Pseudonocardia phyllosphaerae]|uniref:FecCD family ABC transporter permease n=1 Tax=Pseudonocardia phyllosphaerae TaxID=3390502 RepID=UPI00397A35EE
MTRTVEATEVTDELDDLEHSSRRRHTLLWIGGLFLALVLTLPLAVGLGPVSIAPGTVAGIVGNHVLGWPSASSWSGSDDTIVWLVRMPRVLLGLAVGAGLGLTGVALQALVRNVLADPHILGVVSGASTGAAASILFGVGAGLGAAGLTTSAFLGSAAATMLLFVLARSGGRITSIRLLLAGVAIGYVLSATTSFLIFASDEPDSARAVLFWLLGSLASARWATIAVAVVVVLVTLTMLVLWARRFDALSVGDDSARTLGVSPERFRIAALILVSLCVGAVVAVAGGIGFVGLVVPHVARLCVGAAHRRVFPVAALIGAIFLAWADVFARIAFAPRELPLGIVTAVVGAPFLIVLVRRFYSAAV